MGYNPTRRLEGEAQPEPGDAEIFGFVRQHPAGIKEDTHLRDEAILHAGAILFFMSWFMCAMLRSAAAVLYGV
jgi:hypothetical protein